MPITTPANPCPVCAAKAVNYGAAHGALAMTTPGDTSMASLAEVEKEMKGGSKRVER